MGILSAGSLKPGMVLARDLLTPGGRLVLSKGATLSTKHIETIKIWGIAGADIENATPQDNSERFWETLPSEALEEGQRRVDRRFASCGTGHPFLEELYRIAVTKAALRLAKGDDPERFFHISEFPPRRRAAGPLPSPEELIAGEVALSSFPDTYFRVVEVIGSPRSSAWHIADVVAKDTSLTAKLLKLVNSSFYNFPSRIDSLPRAVALIGGNELSTLALGISAVSMFPEIPEPLVSMRNMWRHTVATGVLARLFSMPHPEIFQERIFVAGILHDIGRIVLLRHLPEAMLEALDQERRKNIPLCEAETETLGYDHARLGGLLLRHWKIPPVIENSVAWHHNPSQAPSALEPALLHLADVTSIALGMGIAPAQVAPRLDTDAWRLVGLPPEGLETLVAQSERQVAEILEMFGADETHPRPDRETALRRRDREES